MKKRRKSIIPKWQLKLAKKILKYVPEYIRQEMRARMIKKNLILLITILFLSSITISKKYLTRKEIKIEERIFKHEDNIV